MDDEAVAAKVIRKFSPACKLKMKLLTGMLPNPVRKLYRSDILALPVMGTAFGDKDGIAIL